MTWRRETSLDGAAGWDRFLTGWGLAAKATETSSVPLAIRAMSLARTVYATQKAAQVPCQRDDTDAQKFNRRAVARQGLCPPSPTEMHPPDQPDHRTRDACKYQVQQ